MYGLSDDVNEATSRIVNLEQRARDDCDTINKLNASMNAICARNAHLERQRDELHEAIDREVTRRRDAESKLAKAEAELRWRSTTNYEDLPRTPG